MRIRLVVSTPGRRFDAVVDAARGVDVAALRAALATACDTAADQPWWSGARPLPTTAVLGGPGLRAGDEVSIGCPGPATAATADLHLAVVGGPGAGSVLPLTRGVHVLGRDVDCDLPLPDAAVSRRHAAVTVTTRGITVRDLDSRNGTTRERGRVDRDGDDLAAGDTVHLGHSRVVVRDHGPVAAAVRAGDDGRVLVTRAAASHSPRPPVTLTVPPVPPATVRPRVAVVAALLPALAAAALAWLLDTWQLLAFAALGPLTLLVTATGDRWSWRAGRRRAAADHAVATARATRQRDRALALESADRHARHPDPAAGQAAAAAPAATLWDRRPGDADRWHVRLGTASRPSAVTVLGTDGAATPAGLLTEVPVCADLARGPLGVSGPIGHATAIARAVVTHLAVGHAPGDLDVVALLSDPLDHGWDWLRWLPHPVRRAATPDEHTAVVAALAARVAAPRTGRAPSTGRCTLLLVDRAGALAGVPGLADVLAHGVSAGVFAVCVDDAATALPGACRALARTEGPTHAVLRLAGTGWDTADGRPDVAGRVLADQVSPERCEDLARALAPLADGSDDDGLPGSVRWRDLVPVAGVDAVIAAWSRAPDSDPPLRAVVGAGPGGPVTLDLTADGPHALVAGTTGAGKSELLRTWVAALAAAHPPDDLRFLLVDYKGGAAFGACARLPHTAGSVTDLDPHLTGRVLRSLDAELRRRERAFAQVGAADLTAHRRAGGEVRIPRVVVVVDEFATLAADLPDFVPGLVDVAQRGRSLGVHLVLATQRPGHAVSPAIRANTTLRVCLRVTDAAESSDVVDVPDAAGLDPRTPGRAVARTGRGWDLVQTAHVGGAAPGAEVPVVVHRVGPWEDPPAVLTADGGRTDLDDLVDLLAAAWERRTATGATQPAPLWHPPLPDELIEPDLTATLGAEAPGHVARLLIGLRDEPALQRRRPEVLDLDAGGTLLAAGAGRSGRTTLLRVVAGGAARAGVPLVLVGAEGARGAAHPDAVVARAAGDDAATLDRLLDLLEAEFAARRADPRRATPLAVLVDDLARVVATLDDLDGGRGAGRLLGLFQAAGSVGVTVVGTGGREVLTPRVAASADRVLLLRPADPSDAAAVGLTARDLPVRWPPGRGVWAPGGDVVQLVRPPDVAPGDPSAVRPTATGLRLQALPVRVGLAPRHPGGSDRVRLGVGGDDAAPVTVDPWAGGGRLVVAGPPRTGRSATLALLADEAAALDAAVYWWARPGSPLAVTAGRRGWTRLDRTDTDPPPCADGRALVVLDDADELAETPLSEALALVLRSAPAGRWAVVVAGRPDELVVAYRGVVAEVRRARRGLLLHPGPGDGDLVGVRTGRHPGTAPPGRGLLVADGTWVGDLAVGPHPVPVQVALPAGAETS